MAKQTRVGFMMEMVGRAKRALWPSKEGLAMGGGWLAVRWRRKGGARRWWSLILVVWPCIVGEE